jgi:FAD/FMN-containing dehydrogenase
MTAVDERLGDMLSLVPQASLLTDPDVTESYGLDWAPDQVGDDVMELTRRIKFALDPQNILNPGALV